MDFDSSISRYFMTAVMVLTLFGSPAAAEVVGQDRSAVLKFRPQMTVDVLIRGQQVQHLNAVLEQVEKLATMDGVSIGSVVVLGTPDEPAHSSRKSTTDDSNVTPGAALLGAPFEYLQRADLPYLEFTSADEFIKTHSLQYSPVWVVKNRGKITIVEGRVNLVRWLLLKRRSENAISF